MAKAKIDFNGMSKEDLIAHIANQEELITELSGQIKKSEIEKEAQAPVIKVGNDQYKLTIPKFKHKGEVITLNELEKNGKLCEELIEMKFAGLVKIEEAPKKAK